MKKSLKQLHMKQYTKKEYNHIQQLDRILTPGRTGTITHKSKKDYDRNRSRKETRKMIDEER